MQLLNKQSDINSIPHEILCKILSYASIHPTIFLLKTVSRKFKQALDDQREISLPIDAQNIDINSVISNYPLVQKINFLIANDIPQHKKPSMELEYSFRGHGNLKTIVSISDKIISGAIECPNLENLILESDHDDETMQDHSSLHPYGANCIKNMAVILQNLPNLKHLQIRNPYFWSRKHQAHSNLSILNLKFKNSDNFSLLIDILLEKHQLHLPNLKQFKVDLNYSVLPENTILALSNGMPLLKILKIRYSSFTFDHLESLIRFHTLEFLSLAQSKIQFPSKSGWCDVIIYLLKSMPHLKNIHIRGCNLLQDSTNVALDLSNKLTTKFTQIVSFKLLDVIENHYHTKDVKNITDLIELFPNLSSLRCDVPSSFPIPYQLKILKKIELRYSKLSLDDTTVTSKKDGHLDFLESVSLWCPKLFPYDFISSHCSQLKSLTINYLKEPLICEKSYEFNRLKHLEIRGIGISAHSICKSSLKIVLKLPLLSLRNLWLDALTKDEEPVGDELFQSLMDNAPNLSSIHLTAFTLPDHIFKKLVWVWPNLHTFVTRSSYQLKITQENLEDEFYPFFNSHRLLETFSISVKTLDLEQFNFLHADMALLMEMSPKDHPHYIRIARNLYNSIFENFSNHLRYKFWWMKSVHVHGPVMRGD